MRARANNFEGLIQDQIQTLCEEAWSVTRSRMTDVANERGVDISGENYHWNHPKYENPSEVLNPNQITEPLDRPTHTDVHQQTTSNTNKPWEGPIDPNNRIDPPPYNLPTPRN